MKLFETDKYVVTIDIPEAKPEYYFTEDTEFTFINYVDTSWLSEDSFTTIDLKEPYYFINQYYSDSWIIR